MAILPQRHPDNISGNFYVDTTCINCDTCRWMAPHSFRDRGDQSIVYHQPTSPEEQVPQPLSQLPRSKTPGVLKTPGVWGWQQYNLNLAIP